MEHVVGIQFNGRGNVYSFSSGELELALHDQVIAEAEQGPALGVVVSIDGKHTAPSTTPTIPPVTGLTGANDEEPAAPPASAEAPCEAPENALADDSFSQSRDSDNPPYADDSGDTAMPPDSGQDDIPGEAAAMPDTFEDAAKDSAADTYLASARPSGGPARELMPILRKATEEDIAAAQSNTALAREAVAYCRECIRKRGLDMKLVDVEIFFDRSKMIFFFTAPARIDFRDLVKDLVHCYRTRIELRQIGVRHETQMIGALGNCGMVCCCRNHLKKFAPVTIKMAKEQNLFLNQAKISGICGRLLCCLSYEQENYEEFHRSCPRLGKRYQTTQGLVKVLRSNIFRNSLIVLTENNEEQEITLPEWAEMAPRRPDQQQQQPSQPQDTARRPQPEKDQNRKGRGGKAADGPSGRSRDRQKQEKRPWTGEEALPPLGHNARAVAEGEPRPAAGHEPQPDTAELPRTGPAPESAPAHAAPHETIEDMQTTPAAPDSSHTANSSTSMPLSAPASTSPAENSPQESAAPADNMAGAPAAGPADHSDSPADEHPDDQEHLGIFGLRRTERNSEARPGPQRDTQREAQRDTQREAQRDGQRSGNRRRRRPHRPAGDNAPEDRTQQQNRAEQTNRTQQEQSSAPRPRPPRPDSDPSE